MLREHSSDAAVLINELERLYTDFLNGVQRDEPDVLADFCAFGNLLARARPRDRPSIGVWDQRLKLADRVLAGLVQRYEGLFLPGAELGLLAPQPASALATFKPSGVRQQRSQRAS